MKKVMLALFLIGFFAISLIANDYLYGYNNFYQRAVMVTPNIPSKLEVDQSVWITVEFTIQKSEAVFNEIFVNEQEHVKIDVYTKRVSKNIDNDDTIIRVDALLRLDEPGFYYLRSLGVSYNIADVEYRYTMESVQVTVYSPVRIEASIPARVICLGQPLLYEVQVTTEKEAEFEYSQEVVRRQVTKTDYGYLARLWLLYTKPGEYEVVPMRAISEYKTYYPSPIQITIVPFMASLSFSSRAVKVGEPLDFTIEVKPLEEGFTIGRHLSAWGKFKVDDLKIDNNGSYKISGKLALFALAGNEYLLGPIGFRYTHDGETNVFYLPAIPIHLQKTITSDAYVLKEPQYGRAINMSIWNIAVLCLSFIVILLGARKVVKIIRTRRPKKEEGVSYRQKLLDARQKEDWLAIACLIKQKIGEGMGLTMEESLSLTIEECGVKGPALTILEIVDKKLFSDEPIGLVQIYDEFIHSLDRLLDL